MEDATCGIVVDSCMIALGKAEKLELALQLENIMSAF